MSISISRKELLEILPFVHTAIRDFILSSDIQQYYVYGREPIDADYVSINIKDIKVIIDKTPDSSIKDTLNTIYISGYITGQDHVYLYGRM